MKSDEELRQIFRNASDCYADNDYEKSAMTEDRFIEVIHQLSPMRIALIGHGSLLPGEMSKVERLMQVLEHVNGSHIIVANTDPIEVIEAIEHSVPACFRDSKPYIIHAQPRFEEIHVDEIELVKHKDWKQQNNFRSQAHSKGLGFKGEERTMTPQLSLSEAIRLSIIKWEILAQESDFTALKYDKIKSHPKLNIINNCGFCERHKYIDEFSHTQEDCDSCELAHLMGGDCGNPNSVFSKWSRDFLTKDAIALLDIIKSIPNE